MQASNIPFLSSQIPVNVIEQTEMNQSGSVAKAGTSFMEMLNSMENMSVAEPYTENTADVKETVVVYRENSAEKTDDEEISKKQEKSEKKEKSDKTSKTENTDKPRKNDSDKAKKVQLKKNETVSESEEKKDEESAYIHQLEILTGKTKAEPVQKNTELKADADTISTISDENADAILESNQIEFLKLKVNGEDPEDILADAEEYISNADKGKKHLSEAQTKSLENPKYFLDETGIAVENKAASEVTKDSIQTLVAERKNNGKEKEIKSAAKNNSINRENKITVIDQRGTASKEAAEKSSKDKMKISVSEPKDNSVDVTMTLAKTAEQNILSNNAQTAGAAGSNFQAMLSEQIQNNAPEFVKAGNIVLHDSNSGTINLILKPESLGNVKVSLQLSDKVITGQILVNSQEAYDAFKESIDSLKQAFVQNGFDAPQFNLSFANDSSSFANQQQNQNQNANNWNAQRIWGDYIFSGDEMVSTSTSVEYRERSDYSIDYIA